MKNPLIDSQLGKKTSYICEYQPDLLFPIPRQGQRDELHVSHPLPFHGADLWNAYEISWLNEKGKPVVAIGIFTIPCTSPKLVESKSFKLYLNSLNQTKFKSRESVLTTLQKDLSLATESPVDLKLYSLQEYTQQFALQLPQGICLDELDISVDTYSVDPSLLRTLPGTANETLYSDLLKSNCLVTSQPDWGTVEINYRGPKIDHTSLLKYFISYRQHNEFGEHCVERIFMDISKTCHPESLTVWGYFTRRGGLDINPCRSTEKSVTPCNKRFSRQ